MGDWQDIGKREEEKITTILVEKNWPWKGELFVSETGIRLAGLFNSGDFGVWGFYIYNYSECLKS